jgi:hypothetical protein
MLELLDTDYGAITTDDLEANFAKLSLPWDPTSPIENVFTQVTSVRQFAVAGGDPISDATATREILKIFEQSGVFETALEQWRLQAINLRTYALLLPFFRTRNTERLRVLGLTGNKYSANKVEQNSKHLMDQLAYCWTHGASTNAAHTSATCSNKQDGHVDSATLLDMKGGNNFIRRAPGERQVYKRPERENRNTGNSRRGSANSAQQEATPAAAGPTPAAAGQSYAAVANAAAAPAPGR